MAAAITSFKGEHDYLSNFYGMWFAWQDTWFPSAEHAYQWAKTLMHEEKREILAAETPGRAKRLGQRVTLRPGWEDMRVEVMLDILRTKFAWNGRIARLLVETGDAELIEGNAWGDRFWGCTWSNAEHRWVGENHLGKLLMQVREELSHP